MAWNGDTDDGERRLLEQVSRNPYIPPSVKNLFEDLTTRLQALEAKVTDLETKQNSAQDSLEHVDYECPKSLHRHLTRRYFNTRFSWLFPLNDNEKLCLRLSDIVLPPDSIEKFTYGFLDSYEKEPTYEHIDPVSGTILNAKKGNEIFNLGGKDNHLSPTGKRVLENVLSGAYQRKCLQILEALPGQIDFCVDFKKERERCLQQKILFEDPAFPANDSSIFKNPSLHFMEQTEFQRKYQDCVWLRPNEIVAHPQFFVAAQSRFDVKQGGLGDCFLVASVATLAMHEELFYRVVPLDQSFTDNYAGIFHFQFWHFGEWIDVVIDDRLPTQNGQLIFVKSEDENEFWSALLEKAYAKLYGGYECLKGGSLSDVMEDLTGGIVECYRLEDCTKPLLRALMEMAFCTGSMINCGTGDTGVEEDKNLFTRHAYSCTGFAKVYHSKLGVVQLVRIRNPWGSKLQWTGAWGDTSEEWNYVSEAEKKNLEMVVADDGEFWMSFDDFFREFATVNVCTLSVECIDDMCKMVGGRKILRDFEWGSTMLHGRWTIKCGISGENILNALFSNPQYLLTVEADVKPKMGSRRKPVIIEVHQKHLKGTNSLQYMIIGFFVFKCSVAERLCMDNLPNDIDSVAPPLFAKARQLTRRIYLDPGSYVLVPTPYATGNEVDFLIRVFSNNGVSIRQL